jgi:hypothetical protein
VAELADRACLVIRAEGVLDDVAGELDDLVRSLPSSSGGLPAAPLRSAAPACAPQGLASNARTNGRGAGRQAGNALATAEAVGAVTFARALVEAVRARRESRGPHLRFESWDSPAPTGRDDASRPFWTRMRHLGGGRIASSRETPPGLPFEMPSA